MLSPTAMAEFPFPSDKPPNLERPCKAYGQQNMSSGLLGVRSTTALPIQQNLFSASDAFSGSNIQLFPDANSMLNLKYSAEEVMNDNPGLTPASTQFTSALSVSSSISPPYHLSATLSMDTLSTMSSVAHRGSSTSANSGCVDASQFTETSRNLPLLSPVSSTSVSKMLQAQNLAIIHPTKSLASNRESTSNNKVEAIAQDRLEIKDEIKEEDCNLPPKKRTLSAQAENRDEPEDASKNDQYWEKRKKNNDSAKRSRDARRLKEEQIALRVVYLEQENLQLRTEASLLRSEIEKLRCMLYNR